MSRLCGVGCWNCDLYGVVESCEVPGGGIMAKICGGGSDKVSEVNAAGVVACRYLGFRLGE